MPRARLVVPVVFALAAMVGAGGWWRHHASQPIELTLFFRPFVGAEPLVLHETRYPNPGGEGRFEVRDFQFYVSNLRLTSPTGVYAEPDSYHVVRFDGPEPGFAIVLRGVPRRDYRRVEFGIGVDPAANKALTHRGDLDPNGRMAWTWEVGYKFVLLEGTLTRDGASIPLVYHVGFDESYEAVSMDLGQGELRVDLLALFQGPPAVDMAELPTVKFDRGDAARLAGNFAALVTPMRTP